MNARRASLVAMTLVLVLQVGVAHAQGPAPGPPPQLRPVPVPPQNPITEAKRVLGKILFWDEQVSSDNTMACGTCHTPPLAGADRREGVNPGPDKVFGTVDDIIGSPGVTLQNSLGDPVPDAVFGLDVQVTSRSAQAMLMAAHSPVTFWDGRGASAFSDPETGTVLIPGGGALESQAVQPILNSGEMARAGRTWGDVRGKLAGVQPLALAGNLPPDVAAAIAAHPTYPALFTAAFGTPEITGARIAFAIATYERTLVPDQTPYDRFAAGDQTALTAAQQRGLGAMGNACGPCHRPPVFSDQSFRNIGLRPDNEDIGREGVTGLVQDRSRFKVPSLRNVGLKATFMHNGSRSSLEEVLNFYLNIGSTKFPAPNLDPLVVNINLPPQAVRDIIDFLRNGLTDPRVAAGAAPFDRPTLSTEVGVASVDPAPGSGAIAAVRPAYPNPFNAQTTLRFTLTRAADVRVSIFSAQGQLVRRLSASFGPGAHELAWDGTGAHGRPADPGVYLYRIAAGGDVKGGRITRIR